MLFATKTVQNQEPEVRSLNRKCVVKRATKELAQFDADFSTIS